MDKARAKSAIRFGLRRYPRLGALVDRRQPLGPTAAEVELESVSEQLAEQLAESRRDADELRGRAGWLAERVDELEKARIAVGMFPPGHYYSPIPAEERWRPRLRDLRGVATPGVDLATDHQLSRLDELAPLLADASFPRRAEEAGARGFRYHLDNDFFGARDGLLLHAMLRQEPPKRVIEVGSGFSSAMMLDTDERHLGSATEFTFIEPYPDRLHRLLRDSDRSQGHIRIVEETVQAVPDRVFRELERGDILFIDSSHVVSTGGDVNRLLLELVPALPVGVRVHVHDIFWPFDYPEVWLEEGRFWSETYLLHALLIGNRALGVDVFTSYLFWTQHDEVARRAPAWDATGSGGVSIWLRTRD